VRFTHGGMTVALTDPAEMTSAILALARSDAARKQFSTNAEAAFHSSFTLQAMVDAYMDLYLNTPRAHRSANR